jgi:hypothetical protein
MTGVTDDSGKASFFYDDAMMPMLAKEKVSRPLFGVTVKRVWLAATYAFLQCRQLIN